MKILFYPLTSKKNKKGLAPLYIRITCGPESKMNIPTGKFVDPELWNVDKKKVDGKSVQADIINKYITSCENKLNKIESDFQDKDEFYNAEIIRNMYLGTHIQRYGLLQVLDMHNELFFQKIGQKDFSKGRYSKYTGLKKKLQYFMNLKYKRTEMFMTEMTMDFIESFWHFLTTTGKEVRGKFAGPMDSESACGIITMLKKIGKIGCRKQGIAINQFDDFKCSFSKESKEPLTMDEVNKIMHHDFKYIKRLDRVRDRVIIGCFTGMADSDIQSCTADMITSNMHGEKWINRGRTKTGELCIIPLWQPVLDVIEKYKDDPELKDRNLIFPQISLQKMNVYLQEIADVCGITKHITTHICRHTFGDLYLNSGGSIENLARILGHSSTKTTAGYARRNKKTITEESNKVKEKLFGYMELLKNDQLIVNQ